MFDINNNKKIDSDSHLIAENYLDLHFDIEPILFTGTNIFGNRILGSSVDEDEEKQIQRFFHTQITSEQYIRFVNRRISYLELLEDAKTIFVVDKVFDNSDTTSYLINISDIPSDYLPSEDSLCPELNLSPSTRFAVSLQGKLASLFSAVPEELGESHKKFSELIKSAFKGIKDIIPEPIVTINAAYAQSSFKTYYQVELKGFQEDFFDTYEKSIAFLNLYINYCISDLNSDVDNIFSSEASRPDSFNKLLRYLENIYGEKKHKHLEDILLDELKKSSFILEDISENIGRNYNSIEVLSVSDFAENPIGYMDSGFSSTIKETVEKVEEFTSTIETDPKPVEYRVQIYHLNTDTRRGNAFIDIENQLLRPKIMISGDGPLEKSIYTESLHENKYIKVLGIGKKVNGKLRRIDIQYREIE